MTRKPMKVRKDPGPRGPEKVECSRCGKNSRLNPHLLIKTITVRLNGHGWIPDPISPGDWVCPKCKEELDLETEADDV